MIDGHNQPAWHRDANFPWNKNTPEWDGKAEAQLELRLGFFATTLSGWLRLLKPTPKSPN